MEQSCHCLQCELENTLKNKLCDHLKSCHEEMKNLSLECDNKASVTNNEHEDDPVNVETTNESTNFPKRILEKEYVNCAPDCEVRSPMCIV